MINKNFYILYSIQTIIYINFKINCFTFSFYNHFILYSNKRNNFYIKLQRNKQKNVLLL